MVYARAICFPRLTKNARKRLIFPPVSFTRYLALCLPKKRKTAEQIVQKVVKPH